MKPVQPSRRTVDDYLFNFLFVVQDKESDEEFKVLIMRVIKIRVGLREAIRIPSRILHRFYKNRCHNEFSKTGLSKPPLKFSNYLQKCHCFTYDIGFYITVVKPAS